MKPELKKLLVLNLPYLLFVYLFAKCGQAYRLAAGADASAKLLHLTGGISAAFANPLPSLHPFDLCVGVVGAVAVRLIVYSKGKNAKKYRKGEEYGSARWGTAKDIAPYIDPKFENNILLTQTERLTMTGRPKDPKTARNKNVLVIGGSGSGKTRFYVKPNLMQCFPTSDYPTSFVVTDPKGTLVLETGQMFQRAGYRVKILNTINFSKSMKYNPFVYIHSEKDVLKLVNADDFRIFCRNKEDALRTKEAVTEWITERLRLEVSPEKTRIVNVRKRYSEFLGFKIRVRPKSNKYIVQSHICDKKLELERQKLVEQAKRIARPSEGKRPLDEIRLYNSMVLGIQNYYQLATCISIDCRKIHRQVMTVLTNRLNTETGCKLVREGGTMTQSEKERFGKSAMVRYVSGIDQPIYPIAYIKNKIPMAKKTAVCSYTADGRALIHTNLSLNSFVLTGLRSQPSGGRSTELTDSRISLFSAQRGKCALCGDLFENAAEIVCWLKTPAEMGGKERYQNMILFHERFLPLLQDCPQNELKAIADTFKATKELMLKVNSLREQAGLSAIEI